MGQKVNPIGMRLALTKDWRSRWYADKRDFGTMLKEDVDIREIVSERLKDAAVSDIYIERYANRIRVTMSRKKYTRAMMGWTASADIRSMTRT